MQLEEIRVPPPLPVHQLPPQALLDGRDAIYWVESLPTEAKIVHALVDPIPANDDSKPVQATITLSKSSLYVDVGTVRILVDHLHGECCVYVQQPPQGDDIFFAYCL